MSRWGEVVTEDLGAVLRCLRPSLDKLGVPGYRVLRWEAEGDGFATPQAGPRTRWPPMPRMTPKPPRSGTTR